MSFLRTYPLRFAHCDPAGIAYYPRCFEIFDAAIEDWTSAILGVSRRILHLELGLALPTVLLDAEFIAVSRLGDPLDLAIDLTSVGNSSITLRAEISSNGEHRFRIGCKQVLMKMSTATAEPWPDEWRERLEREKQS